MRRRLANRRPRVGQDLTWVDVRGVSVALVLCVGFNGAGAVQELFLTGPKIGSDLAAALSDASVGLSLALQNGVPLAALAASMGWAHRPGDAGDSKRGGKQPISPLGLALDAALAIEAAEGPGIAAASRVVAGCGCAGPAAAE